MNPIDHAIREVSKIGLKCERFPARNPTGYHRWKFLIAGQKCHVITASVSWGRLSVRLPKSPWADFFIYVSNGTEATRFFIVPRGAVGKHTSLCSPESWLAEYEGAWHLLSDDLDPEKLKRRYELFNWKMKAIIRAALDGGHRIELIPKPRFKWPPRVQNRLFINGRRCQLMSASRVNADVINIRAPKNTWAEFVCFMVPAKKRQHPIFIIPRDQVPTATTTTLRAPWLRVYADAWQQIVSVD